MSRYCRDPYEAEREGKDAARWGPCYDYEHRERIDNARLEYDSCDYHYAKGYRREIEHREEQRREEEEMESREREAAERRQWEQRQEEQEQWDTFCAEGYPEQPYEVPEMEEPNE